MKNKFLTVDSLRKVLNKISECGYGDMRIKCQDGYLHDDEISFNYIAREILLRGFLYNFSPTEKIKEFKNDIENAYKKYYDTTNIPENKK